MVATMLYEPKSAMYRVTSSYLMSAACCSAGGRKLDEYASPKTASGSSARSNSTPGLASQRSSRRRDVCTKSFTPGSRPLR